MSPVIAGITMVDDATEAEVVATHLRADWHSSRFGHPVRSRLVEDGAPESIVLHPDLSNAEANAYRLDLLARRRGWNEPTSHYRGRPAPLRWTRVTIDEEGLAAVRYPKARIWKTLSGGSLRPADVAARLHAGLCPDVDADQLLAIAEAIGGGAEVPPLILLAVEGSPPLAIDDGSMRMTALHYAPEHRPARLAAYVGWPNQP